MKLKIAGDDPFREVICSFLSGALPAVQIAEQETMVDVLAESLIGTGRVRFGPAPNPESLVAIRAAIRASVESKLPIRLLIPWGSKKPHNGHSVDLAEIMALKMLGCVISRLTERYAPGVETVVRIEDLSGWYLFEREGPAAMEASHRYVADLRKLFQIVGLRNVMPRLESEYINQAEYAALVATLEPFFADYLLNTEGQPDDPSRDSLRQLSRFGWKGIISAKQRAFYYSRYERTRPDLDDHGRRLELAHYFATVLARVKVNGYGNWPSWGNNFIGFTFHPPIPDSVGLVDRRVYYRTLPTDYTRDHIPPWRARGYLKIQGRQVTPKVCNWNGNGLNFTTVPLTLEGNGETLTVQTEYVETE